MSAHCVGAGRIAEGVGERPYNHPMILRWRNFGLVRWLGLALLLAGGAILFSRVTWWAGLILALAGFVLVEGDNSRLRRRRHMNSVSRDGDA